ncbi:MAG: hypothetical protein GF308_21445 [Candidatus Heimdallarchaeota archaeon]|nr:hypothetical protein [Candidatus Heimdallarchaeota archaeon]
MFDKGIYYFWTTSITLDERFQSITRWIQTKLDKQPEDKQVFPAKIWRNSGYQRSNLNVPTRKKWDLKIEKQLKVIERDVETKAPLYTLSEHLLPLEHKGFWCGELEILLATYWLSFEQALKEGLKRKCNWLRGYITENNLSLEGTNISLKTVTDIIKYRRYRCYYEDKIAITIPEDFSNRHIEWLLKKIGGIFRVQKTQFVNHYPIYKILFTNTRAIVNAFELEERITEMWGEL